MNKKERDDDNNNYSKNRICREFEKTFATAVVQLALICY
jgi:hypothetical protein